ncbi:SURF1 family protein [Methylobacterium trifolii]|uniref:SURF1 family protein n=1 Tax=Methylobacterium trifolii TaxID=1003092 RepID=UPI001EDF18FD|nr:SURF1 family protein [Methylobacterium trifolii]
MAALVILDLAGLLILVVLVGLGTWQVQRRAWKLDLIAQVEARVHAPAVAAPGPADWPGITSADAYRRVRLTGRFLHDRASLVQAVTVLGGGFWVMTPLEAADGVTVLVNRGFVPADRRDPAGWSRPDGSLTATGLLRVSEPGGGFLRTNAPSADRWYSRDVADIAGARGLGTVAPYFIDAEAGPDPSALPVGGLTVVAFSNNHLVYAITWFTLAAMVLAAMLYGTAAGLRPSRSADPGGD